MNIHFQQAEKKSQVFFYIFVALAFLSAMMVLLNASSRVEVHLSIPASSAQGVALENNTMPVAIPAPLPPAEQVQSTNTPAPSATVGLLPQAVPVPTPDLP